MAGRLKVVLAVHISENKMLKQRIKDKVIILTGIQIGGARGEVHDADAHLSQAVLHLRAVVVGDYKNNKRLKTNKRGGRTVHGNKNEHEKENAKKLAFSFPLDADFWFRLRVPAARLFTSVCGGRARREHPRGP